MNAPGALPPPLYFNTNVLPTQPSCLCHNIPLGEPLHHWCGWPQPCCSARRDKRWLRTKNLDHLRICHQKCWKRDAVEVMRRVRSEGEITVPGHLRLCHRRCYANDLIRNQKWQLTRTTEPVGERREVVPQNQSWFEKVGGPQVQHWVVRWQGVEGDWEVAREDHPWPESLLPWRGFSGRRVLRMAKGWEREGGGEAGR